MAHKSISPTVTSGSTGIIGRVAAIGVPLGVVAVVLAVVLALRYRAETAVANVAGLLPFGWAFAAGMVSSVNPCGFFMLPAYLSYQLGTEEEGFFTSPPYVRILKALRLGLVATLGFVVLMAAVGSVIAAGGRQLVQVFPYAGVGIGIVLMTLGAWLLITRRTIAILAASRVAVTPRRNLRNVFLFGMAYAISSLSCTLPIFLLVVGNALASRGAAASFGQFVSYGVGMGLVLVAVTIGAALSRGAMARWLRGASHQVHRASALFLIGAGAYLIYYWVWFSGAIL